MILNGIHFRKARNVVLLPNFDAKTGEKFPHAERENYCYFGRIIRDHSKVKPGVHVPTHYYMDNDPQRTKLHAEVIPNKGHSLTNMMYGADGRVYLAYKGLVYTSVLQKRQGA
jgi:hypothetical protein